MPIHRDWETPLIHLGSDALRAAGLSRKSKTCRSLSWGKFFGATSESRFFTKKWTGRDQGLVPNAFIFQMQFYLFSLCFLPEACNLLDSLSSEVSRIRSPDLIFGNAAWYGLTRTECFMWTYHQRLAFFWILATAAERVRHLGILLWSTSITIPRIWSDSEYSRRMLSNKVNKNLIYSVSY